MIRSFITTMGIIYIGFFISVQLSFLYMEMFVRDKVVNTMVESAQIATITSLDASSRVRENFVGISEEIFEETFEETFHQNITVNVEVDEFSYQYLKGEEDNLKAVRVKMRDVEGTEFQAVLRENINISE